MSWQMLGAVIYTADNSSSAPGVKQSFTFTDSCYKKAAKVGIIEFNNPTYTSVQLKIYGSRNGSLGKLLYTSSNTITKAQIDEGLAHAYKEVYFEFDSPLPFHAGTEYFAAIFINGSYVGDSVKHLAWKNGWPDPVFKTGVVLTQANAARYPLEIDFIAAEVV